MCHPLNWLADRSSFFCRQFVVSRAVCWQALECCARILKKSHFANSISNFQSESCIFPHLSLNRIILSQFADCFLTCSAELHVVVCGQLPYVSLSRIFYYHNLLIASSAFVKNRVFLNNFLIYSRAESHIITFCGQLPHSFSRILYYHNLRIASSASVDNRLFQNSFLACRLAESHIIRVFGQLPHLSFSKIVYYHNWRIPSSELCICKQLPHLSPSRIAYYHILRIASSFIVEQNRLIQFVDSFPMQAYSSAECSINTIYHQIPQPSLRIVYFRIASSSIVQKKIVYYHNLRIPFSELCICGQLPYLSPNRISSSEFYRCR